MIVTITMNPAVDKSTTVEKFIPEKKLRGTSMITEAGGGGINVSKAINKLGGKSLAIFPAGGIEGKLLHQMVEGQIIACKVIPVANETRESFTVTETATNDSTVL